MTFIATAVVAGAQAALNSENQERQGIFGWLTNLGATAIKANQADVDAGRANAVGDPIILSTLEIDPPVSKLSFNNVNQPLPTPNNTVTLREYEGAPIPQQDAEFNFINLTDRINQLIETTAGSDTAIVDAINSIHAVIEDISTAVTSNTTNITSNTTNIANVDGNIQNEFNELKTEVESELATQQSNIESQLNNLDDSVSTHISPVGAIMAFAGSTAPSFWKICDGSVVSRQTYSALFTAIGTTYGAGNGSTTFKLPDLRGRVVAGVGASGTPLASYALGTKGGSEAVGLTEANMPQHSHPIYCSNDDARDSGSGSGYSVHKSNIGQRGTNVVSRGGKTIYTGVAGGSGTTHENVQPTIALNYIIHKGV